MFYNINLGKNLNDLVKNTETIKPLNLSKALFR